VPLYHPQDIELTWTPIAFQDKGGYYEISVGGGELLTVISAP